MSKPISNAQYRRNVISMPREKQIESVECMSCYCDVSVVLIF